MSDAAHADSCACDECDCECPVDYHCPVHVTITRQEWQDVAARLEIAREALRFVAKSEVMTTGRDLARAALERIKGTG